MIGLSRRCRGKGDKTGGCTKSAQTLVFKEEGGIYQRYDSGPQGTHHRYPYVLQGERRLSSKHSGGQLQANHRRDVSTFSLVSWSMGESPNELVSSSVATLSCIHIHQDWIYIFVSGRLTPTRSSALYSRPVCHASHGKFNLRTVYIIDVLVY